MKNMKLGTKLISGFLSVVVLAVIVGTIGYNGMSKIVYQLEISKLVNRIIVDAGDAQAGSLRYIIYNDEKYFDIAEEEKNNIIQLAKDAKGLMKSEANRAVADNIISAIEDYHQANVDFKDFEIQKGEVGKVRAAAAKEVTNKIVEAIGIAKDYSSKNKNEYDAVERVYLVQEARNAMNRVRITANKYVNNPTSDLESALLIEVANIDDILVDARDRMASNKTKKAITESLAALANYKEQFTKFSKLVADQKEVQADQRVAATELLTLAREQRGGVYKFIDKTKNSAFISLFLVGILAAVVGIALGIFITRNIKNDLGGEPAEVADFANQLANGNLMVAVDSNRKHVGVYASMVKMIDVLKNIVVNITDGADSITSAAREMTNSSQEMSSGSSEQASSAEEVSSSMEEMVANIQQNTDNSRQTETIAVKATKGVREGSDATNIAVNSMKNIADKIKIINDIAFQTNILALNAAVEAARAGEHGKGFAVVAAEVRKLAERSKVAADEIDVLTVEGVNVSQQAGEKLVEIVPEIEKTASLVQEIAAASIEQNSGAEQVNSAIQQLNRVTQQNAAVSEEMAASAEELTSQAESLREMIGFFKLERDGRKSKVLKTIQPSNNQIKKPAEFKAEKGELIAFNEDVEGMGFETYK